MKKFVEWLQNAEEGMIVFNNAGGHLADPFSLWFKIAPPATDFFMFLWFLAL